MIPYKAFPSHFGWIQVHGLFEAIGFFVAILLLARYVKKRNPDKIDNMYGIALWVVIGSVVGARLAYVFGNWNLYKDNIMQAFNLLGGGLSYFGGLVAAVLFAYLYCRRKKLDFFEYADLFAVYIPLGHAIGRIGDYLIGEHIGTSTRWPMGILYQGDLRHPIPLYDMLFNLGLFFFLIWMRRKHVVKGSLLAIYLIGYGGFRFLTSYIRIDEKIIVNNSIIQYFALLLFIIGIIWLYLMNRKNKSNMNIGKQKTI